MAGQWRRLDTAPTVALVEADWAAQYTLLLGVDSQTERVLFNAISAVLLRGLPEGWTLQVDAKQRAYFWNTLNGESLWAHPDHEIFTAIIELYRMSSKQPNPGIFLRHVLHQLEQQSLTEGKNWRGPYFTAQGDRYWHDANTGVSSWQDPREEISRRHVVRSGLVLALLADAEQKPRAQRVPTRAQMSEQDLKVQSLPSSPSSQLPPRPPDPFSVRGCCDVDDELASAQVAPDACPRSSWPQPQAAPASLARQENQARSEDRSPQALADRIAASSKPSRQARPRQAPSAAALAEEAAPVSHMQPFPGLWPNAQLERATPSQAARQAPQSKETAQDPAGARTAAWAQAAAPAPAAASSVPAATRETNRAALPTMPKPVVPAELVAPAVEARRDCPAAPSRVGMAQSGQPKVEPAKAEAVPAEQAMRAAPAPSVALEVKAPLGGRAPLKAELAAPDTGASAGQPARQAAPSRLKGPAGPAAPRVDAALVTTPPEEQPAATNIPASEGQSDRQATASRLRGPVGPAAPTVDAPPAATPSVEQPAATTITASAGQSDRQATASRLSGPLGPAAPRVDAPPVATPSEGHKAATDAVASMGQHARAASPSRVRGLAASPVPRVDAPVATPSEACAKEQPAATNVIASEGQSDRQATASRLRGPVGPAAPRVDAPPAATPSEGPPAAVDAVASVGQPIRQATPSRLRGPAGPAAPRVDVPPVVTPSEAAAQQAQLQRQRCLERLKRSSSARHIQHAWKAHRREVEDQVRRKEAQIAEQVSQWRSQRAEAARAIQASWRRRIQRQRLHAAVQELLRRRRQARLEAARVQAATDIQRRWRGVEARRLAQLLRVEQRAKRRRAILAKQRAQAALVLQCAWRCRLARRRRGALAAERARAAQLAAQRAAQLAEVAAHQAEALAQAEAAAPPAQPETPPPAAPAASPGLFAGPPAPAREPELEAEAQQALIDILEESSNLPVKETPSPEAPAPERPRRTSKRQGVEKPKPAALEIMEPSPTRDRGSMLWWQWGDSRQNSTDATPSPTNVKRHLRRRRSSDNRQFETLQSCSEVSSIENSVGVSPAGSSQNSFFKRNIPLFAEDDILTKHVAMNSSGSITRGTTSTRSTAMGSTRTGFESVASGSDIASFAGFPESPCQTMQASTTPLAYRAPSHGLNPALIHAGHQLASSRSQPVLSNARMGFGAASNSRKGLGQGGMLTSNLSAGLAAARPPVPGM